MALGQVGKIWAGWSYRVRLTEFHRGVMAALTSVAYVFMYKDVQRKRHQNMVERKSKKLEEKKAKRHKELEEIRAQAKRDSIL